MLETKDNMETTYITDLLLKCEDVSEFQNIVFPLLETQKNQWKREINRIIKDVSEGNKKSFAQKCNVSRVTVNKWCRGAIPRNRETFLHIGMAAKYDINNINLLLTRYGRYTKLYSKSLSDCICIFVIKNYSGSEAVNKYEYILKKIKDNINIFENENSNSFLATEEFNYKLYQVKNENELEQFIQRNINTFRKAYDGLYNSILMYMEQNHMPGSRKSINDMSIGQEWSSSLKKCVYQIRQRKWYPTRNKIISLGIHLSMTKDQVDEMLYLAHMEPLYAKNTFEGVIIFILESANLNDIIERKKEDFNPDGLYLYARKIMKNIHLPEIEKFISEVSENEEA